MLSSVFVLLGLFGSPDTPADRPILVVPGDDRAVVDVPDASTADKDICDIIGQDYAKCQLIASCRWDPENARCELAYGGYCGSFGVPGTCASHPDCFWDSHDARCKHI